MGKVGPGTRVSRTNWDLAEAPYERSGIGTQRECFCPDDSGEGASPVLMRPTILQSQIIRQFYVQANLVARLHSRFATEGLKRFVFFQDFALSTS